MTHNLKMAYCCKTVVYSLSIYIYSFACNCEFIPTYMYMNLLLILKCQISSKQQKLEKKLMSKYTCQ